MELIWHFIILTSINAQILLLLVPSPSPFFHGSIKFSPHRGANLSTPDKHKDSLSPQISSLQIALPTALRIRGEITPNIWKCSLYLKSVIKEMRCVRKCKVWGVTESSVSLCFDNYAAKRVPEKRQLNCGWEVCGGCWFWGPTKKKNDRARSYTYTHTVPLHMLMLKTCDLTAICLTLNTCTILHGTSKNLRS